MTAKLIVSASILFCTNHSDKKTKTIIKCVAGK